jgi:hypothetical protein
MAITETMSPNKKTLNFHAGETQCVTCMVLASFCLGSSVPPWALYMRTLQQATTPQAARVPELQLLHAQQQFT